MVMIALLLPPAGIPIVRHLCLTNLLGLLVFPTSLMTRQGIYEFACNPDEAHKLWRSPAFPAATPNALTRP